MNFSLGADLIEVRRIKKALNRWGDRFLNRVFSPDEVKYCKRKKAPEVCLAARFAAKEAAMKALGTGLSDNVSWKDFEVIRGPRGRPEMRLSGKIEKRMKRGKILITLSHTREHALAVALLVEAE